MRRTTVTTATLCRLAIAILVVAAVLPIAGSDRTPRTLPAAVPVAAWTPLGRSQRRTAASRGTATAATVAATHTAARPSTYVVRRGDSWYRIAAKLGVSVRALLAANGTTKVTTPLHPGDVLRVPGAPAAPPTTKKPPTTTTTKHATTPTTAGRALSTTWKAYGAASYKVVRGDTWSAIAAKVKSRPDILAVVNRRPQSQAPPVGAALSVPGAWVCPVAGASVIDDWGYPRTGGRKHEGNDLFAKTGTAIRAEVAGTAVQGSNNLGGNTVQLSGADGVRYYHAHLSAFAKKGAVKAGDVIGYVGTSGDARGGASHLHLEVHPGGGAAIDPYPSVALACKR